MDTKCLHCDCYYPQATMERITVALFLCRECIDCLHDIVETKRRWEAEGDDCVPLEDVIRELDGN